VRLFAINGSLPLWIFLFRYWDQQIASDASLSRSAVILFPQPQVTDRKAS
jgi:hypothetical protein